MTPLMARPFADEDYGAYLEQMLRPVRERWPETGDAISTPQPIFLGGWATVHVHLDGGEYETYVTSDVVALTHQLRSQDGFFELLMTCNDQKFAQWSLTQVAALGEQQVLNDGSVVRFTGKSVPLAGVVLERFSTFTFKGAPYAIFRCHGSSATELQLAEDHGLEAFIDLRKRRGVYPRTLVSKQAEKGAGDEF